MFTTEKIEERLDSLLVNKFGCSDEKVNIMKENRFLSTKIGFSAANLFELFLEIEKEFGLYFSEDEIMSTQFDDYRSIVVCIEKKAQGGKKNV